MPLASSHRFNRRRRFGVAAVLVALLGASIVGGMALADREETSAKPAEAKPKTTPGAPQAAVPRDVGRPERLIIKSIGVSAPVKPVGTTADGAQDVPKSIDDTGWWSDGVQPGRAGNAVVVGHTASSAEGVFDKLGKLDRGDDVLVRSARGTLRYDVTWVRSVKVGDFDRISPLIYRPGGRPGLVLLTCGDWNGKRFETTTVVFSTLAAS